jgi:hypothetical protein
MHSIPWHETEISDELHSEATSLLRNGPSESPGWTAEPNWMWW